MVPFVLLCVAVIILSVPVPAPWGHWVACLLAVAALVVAAVGFRGGFVVSHSTAPPAYGAKYSWAGSASLRRMPVKGLRCQPSRIGDWPSHATAAANAASKSL